MTRQIELRARYTYGTLACGAPLYSYMGTASPNPHSPAAGHLFLYNSGRWPAAGEWGVGGVAPIKEEARRRRAVREIKLVQDVKNMNGESEIYLVQHRATITVARSWTENK